jgi:serine O-acetyltransferase
MNFNELKNIIGTDLYRYNGRRGLKELCRNLLLNPGFKFSFIMRVTYFLSQRKYYFPLWLMSLLLFYHYQSKYGIQINYKTKIGKGFYIGHFNCIVVSPGAVIGDNCNISQGVTIGVSGRGVRKGYPVIGNNVYIAPGAKIFGAIKVGDNVAIGANAVVNIDVPANAVVVGIPARVISYNGVEGYIFNTR